VATAQKRRSLCFEEILSYKYDYTPHLQGVDDLPQAFERASVILLYGFDLAVSWAQWFGFVNSSRPKTYGFERVESSGVEQLQYLQRATAFWAGARYTGDA